MPALASARALATALVVGLASPSLSAIAAQRGAGGRTGICIDHRNALPGTPTAAAEEGAARLAVDLARALEGSGQYVVRTSAKQCPFVFALTSVPVSVRGENVGWAISVVLAVNTPREGRVYLTQWAMTKSEGRTESDSQVSVLLNELDVWRRMAASEKRQPPSGPPSAKPR